MSDAGQRAHLNLIESSRLLLELDPGAAVDASPAWLLGAGTPSHPVACNTAFRADDGLAPNEVLAAARDFFGARGRRFSLWVRGGEDADRELEAEALASGFERVYEMPEMLLPAAVSEPPLPARAELRRLTSTAQAEDYWRVAGPAYTSIGFPPEMFAAYQDNEALLDESVAAFIAYMDGEPVSIAMTIVSHGVAGIYWVGSLEAARGMGLGRAVTSAATNAGFELGAEVASLQASPMGRPIYEAMGYETIFDYRLLLSPPL
ncbi:MAG TPA: GNAT family N-acetyltransferase [Solirubrobacterales bacterium]|nr:GNAT family N-acetyltransferase [Solirubrobacterales bacterium]